MTSAWKKFNCLRLIFLTVLFSVLSSLAISQEVASYPSKPIKLIVPVAPGGTVDMVARAIAEPLSRSLGQQVIVENKPGASALLGTMTVAKAAPDGYTILAIATTYVTAPLLVKNAGYDPLTDFVPITETCQIPMVLVVNPEQISAKNLKELVTLVANKPKQFAYASSGNGSTGHIAAEAFSAAAGLSFLHVPYKGNAQAMVDVLAGQVPIMFDQVSTAITYTRSGKLYPIAVTSRNRSSIFPDVPTMQEAGLIGFEDSTFNGLLAPAGTPGEIVKRLHDEVAKILADPLLVKQFAEKGVELQASPSSADFGKYLAKQFEQYRKLAQTANIKAD